MLASTQVFGLLKFAVPLLFVVWTVFRFGPSRSGYNEVIRKFKDEKKLFISDFVQHEVDGEFDGSSIANLCQRKQWMPNVFLSCESPPGGVSNVKNAHLNCIRLAIEMGAELILPGILQRSDKDISAIVPNSRAPIHGNDLDYFFDMGHLIQSLNTYCPQLPVHKSLSDLWDVPSLLHAVTFSPGDAGIGYVNGSIIEDPSQVGIQLKKFVDSKSPPHERRYPIRFHLRATYFTWPTLSDGEPFARHFGRILRIRADARRIAAAALFNLHRRFNLGIDPRAGLKSDSFVGVHLRTEKDTARNGDVPKYEEQAAYYLDYAVSAQSRVVFLATGASQDNVTAFTNRARDFNITTVLKKDILDHEDLAALNKFTYDQRALVDYEIILRAGLMTGTSASPFAWNLAMRRRNAYKEGPTAAEGKRLNDNTQFKDRYSTIFGKSDKGPVMEATIWP